MFIRLCLSHRIHDLVELGTSLTAAAAQAIRELAAIGGTGGLVAVASDGSVAVPFHAAGMYRAWRSQLGDAGIEVW
jgi:isoaspartyl peptidase/L-asparaginase-like protein (Ntn-hydrolase superfamily)